MNQEIAQRQEQLKPLLMGAQRQITSLLQDKDKANKFMAASLVVASDKSLNRCSPDSIVQALIGVAMSELNIDRNIGHCYLVPYGDSAQLQIGYKGFIQLLFRAGWLVKCFPVYNCDDFSMQFDGWNNHVEFTPNIDERDEGDKEWVFNNLRGVYVVSRHSDTKDEYSTFVNKTVIEKLRLNSPNQRASKFTKQADRDKLAKGLPIGVWEDWYIEMAQSKAIKKLAKILPIGDSRTQTALTVDDKVEAGSHIDYRETANPGNGGVIIEMENTDETISTFLDKIESTTTLQELEALTTEAEKFSDSDKKEVRKAWTKQAKKLKPKEEAPDFKELLEKCNNKEELNELLKRMPQGVQLELGDEIDEKFDLFR